MTCNSFEVAAQMLAMRSFGRFEISEWHSTANIHSTRHLCVCLLWSLCSDDATVVWRGPSQQARHMHEHFHGVECWQSMSIAACNDYVRLYVSHMELILAARHILYCVRYVLHQILLMASLRNSIVARYPSAYFVTCMSCRSWRNL